MNLEKKNLFEIELKEKKVAFYLNKKNEIKDKVILISDQLKHFDKNDEFSAEIPALKQDLAIAKGIYEKFELMLHMCKNYDRVSFLTQANPTVMYNLYSKVNSAKKALLSKKIRLLEIDKAIDEGTAADWISALIVDMLRKTQVKNIESSDIKFMALEVFENNKTLKTTEVVLVFRRIITGWYGKLYNTANALTVLPCFSSYQAERLKAQEEIDKEKSSTSNMYDLMNVFSKKIKHLPDDSYIKNLHRKGLEKKGGVKLEDQKNDSPEVKKVKSKMIKLLDRIGKSNESERDELETKFADLGDELLNLEV